MYRGFFSHLQDASNKTSISNVSLLQNVDIFPHIVTPSLCCMLFESAGGCCYVQGMYT